MITIDGSQGEGGGQILRSSLALSAITGQKFRIENIRAGRPKPGLMRQHLICVQAAQAICGAEVEGGELGSTSLTFDPGKIKAGDYSFAIGTAGSVGLVFQTVLMPLALADAPSTLRLTGGTHNMQAPPFEFLDQVFLPQVRRMGFDADVSLVRHGFHPAGGGEMTARIGPATGVHKLVLEKRGAEVYRSAHAVLSNLAEGIATRELREVCAEPGWAQDHCELRNVEASGPGNVLLLSVAFEHVSEIVAGFGERAVSAEQVARRTLVNLRGYLAESVPVGRSLADQLLLPMAVGAGGYFLTGEPTAHTRSNADVIERFLDRSIAIKEIGGGVWRIAVD
jgi:RNA 3'-terminal phosphate cyclase (ATP)